MCVIKCAGLVDVAELHTDGCADRGGNRVEEETQNKWRKQLQHKRKLIEKGGWAGVSEGHRGVRGCWE